MSDNVETNGARYSAASDDVDSKLIEAYQIRSKLLTQRVLFAECLAQAENDLQRSQALEGFFSVGPIAQHSPEFPGFVRTYVLHQGKDDPHRVMYVIDWEAQHYNPKDARESPVFNQNQLVGLIEEFQERGEHYVFPDPAEEFSLAHTIKLARDYFSQDLPNDAKLAIELAKDIFFHRWEMTLGYAEWDEGYMTHCRGRRDMHQGGLIIPGFEGTIQGDNEREETAKAIIKAQSEQHIHATTQQLLEARNRPQLWGHDRGKRAVAIGRYQVGNDFGIGAVYELRGNGRPARRVVVRRASDTITH